MHLFGVPLKKLDKKNIQILGGCLLLMLIVFLVLVKAGAVSAQEAIPMIFAGFAGIASAVLGIELFANLRSFLIVAFLSVTSGTLGIVIAERLL